MAAAGDPLWSDLRFGSGVVFADGVKKGAAQAVPLFSVVTNAAKFESTGRKKSHQVQDGESTAVESTPRYIAIRNQNAT